jgi:lipoprotein-anchoring transpeptidase ErfK/SrfK
MYAEIVPDTPTPEYVPPTTGPSAPEAAPAYASAGVGEHWIDVDLSQQRVYAYEGDTIVNSFLVSTGTWQTPTVTGSYKVWIKLRSTSMTGPGYYLPNVPYVMYFYKGYGLHGTYWHNNFGTPMSHGCVNLTIPDAAWLYDFSAVGTVVNVHY